jgi:hypothetical protein
MRRRLAQEAPIVSVRDLAGGEQKFIHPDEMHRLFVVLSGVAAHQEPSRGDTDERGNVLFASARSK